MALNRSLDWIESVEYFYNIRKGSVITSTIAQLK